VVTTVAGWILLGERLTPLQFFGGAVVLLAVYLNSTGRRIVT
jgi:drug/metabolite transporter (DMT)-like permease